MGDYVLVAGPSAAWVQHYFFVSNALWFGYRLGLDIMTYVWFEGNTEKKDGKMGRGGRG